MSDALVIERDRKGRFLTGVKAGPGRPVGSRNRHAANLLTAFADDFERHGPAIIAQVRAEQPAVYLKLACDLLPRDVQLDVHLDVRQQVEHMLADFRGIGLPDKTISGFMKLLPKNLAIDADNP
jgi:hypothetical protein